MRTVLALAVGVVIGVLLWWLGATPLWATVLAVPPAAFAVLVTRLPRATDVVWSAGPQVPGSISTAHASTLASRLEEAAESRAKYDERFRARLRRLGIDADRLPAPDELAERLRRVE
ncbi:hypothetical protein BBK82_10215 [Lentzea guizhouensis]|uniref:Uncharacterized protein n=1 Tax=Lentzea guizhouensis TaxID=1586287 RepID=A0A1B2HFA3_9PSEU|nr:hypothetical protein [Lentzea guizhouensis]ANZ36380.1 hypothetical protein BBK82_10215 [Lentzea guizhouensis]